MSVYTPEPGVILPPARVTLKKSLKRDSYSDEYAVRSCIVRRLLADGFKREDIRIEIPLDTASSNGRADIVILSERWLRCIEIKSGKDKYDTPEMWEQVRGYKRVFDSVSLIVDKRHRKEWHEKPASGGTIFHSNWRPVSAAYCHESGDLGEQYIRMVDDSKFEETRFEPLHTMHGLFSEWRSGNSKTCVYDMLSILWASEINAAGVKGTKCGFISKAREEYNLKQARELVVKSLRSRPLNKWEEVFWQRFDPAQVTNRLVCGNIDGGGY